MKIAIIGYGGVGKALVSLLDTQKSMLKKEGLDIQVNYVVDYYGGIYAKSGVSLPLLVEFTKGEKDITKFNGGSPDITVEDIVRDPEIDLAVIMTPTNKETGQPGLSFAENLLNAKKHVVISDKGPVMLAYQRLAELAKAQGVQLGVGCTTGGALPSINGGVMDMAGAEITSIEGILNGTTNFILKYMEDNGCEYADALKVAQECGIAETNPTLDVEGWDTAGKLLILTNILMGANKSLDDIQVEGITKITAAEIKAANESGYKYKLVGKTSQEDGKLVMTVKLEKLSSDQLLYGVEGKNKAVRYNSSTLGELVIIGGASGVTPAAASILRDIVNIFRGYNFNSRR